MYYIQDIAKVCGISTQTIRYYERAGLMPPAKRNTDSNYRVYSEEDITQLFNIVQLRSLGFGISEIKKYINNEFTKEEKIHSLKNIIDVCNMQIAMIQGVLEKNESLEIIVRERYSFSAITRSLSIIEPSAITIQFSEMIRYAKKNHLTIHQPASYIIRHDFESQNMTLILPVEPTQDDFLTHFPKTRIVSAYFNGSLDNYDSVISYMITTSQKWGYQIDTTPYERYLLPVNPVNNHCIVEYQFEIIS